MSIQTCCVHVSPPEQAQLEQIVRQGKTPQKVAARARIVLRLANHEPPSGVAAALHVSRMTVLLWADRFVADGLPGLVRDATRPGRRKQITPEHVHAIVEATLRTRPPAATHWSSRTLARAQGVSDGTIRKIWRQHGLQPHRVGRFKLSTDPRFVEKLRDVVGLYLNPPAKAVVFCVDEKSGIQALDRTRPVLPLRPGVPERQTHEETGAAIWLRFHPHVATMIENGLARERESKAVPWKSVGKCRLERTSMPGQGRVRCW